MSVFKYTLFIVLVMLSVVSSIDDKPLYVLDDEMK